MRRIRMMIGALLAAACLVPATAFALGASGLTLASPEVREGTSDIALAPAGGRRRRAGCQLGARDAFRRDRRT